MKIISKTIEKSTEIVAFIGSMKFWDVMLEEASKFNQQGKLVILPIKDPREKIPEEDLKTYDILIRAAIDISTSIHVINKDQYIGKSVKSEIEYAKNKNKPITYMEDPLKVVTLCGSFRFKSVFEEIIEEFSKNGIVVLTPTFFNFEKSASIIDSFSKEQLKNLHDIHDMKIDISDYVLVINSNQWTSKFGEMYIGSDTKREIDYAFSKNKKVLYLSDFRSIEDIIDKIKLDL